MTIIQLTNIANACATIKSAYRFRRAEVIQLEVLDNVDMSGSFRLLVKYTRGAL
jgi:hypothetical protein